RGGDRRGRRSRGRGRRGDAPRTRPPTWRRWFRTRARGHRPSGACRSWARHCSVGPMGPRKPRLFTFRSGGWILARALGLTIAGTAWNLGGLWAPARVRPRGDGRDPASYGFDLTSAIVPRQTIVASGMVADALHALVSPATLAAADLPPKYLVPDDKVIGVVL